MSEPLQLACDLLVGVAWLAGAMVLWRQDRTRGGALVMAAFGATWLLGSLDSSMALLHLAVLALLVVGYPAAQAPSPAGWLAVVAAGVAGIVVAQGASATWTLAFAIGLVGIAVGRVATATGVVRRARAVALLVAGAAGTVLAVGAIARLRGDQVDVRLAYEIVLVIAAGAVAADLRAGRWSRASLTGLVVDLGRRPVGGMLREQLARAVGDPTLTVAYLLDGTRGPVDEHGRPVALPAAPDARIVTPVHLGGRPLALLIHDPASLAEQSLVDGATAALGVAVENARLQSEILAGLAEVRSSTLRLLDAADAERRRLGADLRAHVDPLLHEAADRLHAGGAEPALARRLDDVRAGLFRLAGGLDPVGLHEHGLGPALRELGEGAGLPSTVSVDDGRFAPAVEACAWFVCAEAVANALKHAGASRLQITARRDGDVLHVEVTDDGVGGADPEQGSGLRRLAERVQSTGGRLAIDALPPRGTRVVAELDLSAA